MNVATQGHNNPPSALDSAAVTLSDIKSFGDANPVCRSHEEASSVKLFIDRGKLAIKEADAERDGKVRPLNDSVKAINAEYKAVLAPLDAAVKAIEAPVREFLLAEEAARQRALDAARAAAAALERAAREAEQAEREAIENAAQGDLDASPVSATLAADDAFSRFKAADRAAAVAARDAKVKVGGGFGNAMSLRTVERLEIINLTAAVIAMEGDVDLIAAVETAARRFRREWGELPPGVVAHKARA